MKEMVKYGLILGIICFLASSVLAVVNGITEPQIKKQKELQETLALKEVMPGAEEFVARENNGLTSFYIAYDLDKKIKGFVLKSEGKGYSSTIEVATGINLNLEITDMKVVYQNDTPGLGARVTEPAFREQFKAKNQETIGRIQAITGATISSSAVINSVKDRLAELLPQLKEIIKNAGS